MYSGITDLAMLTDYQRINMANYLKRWRQANNTVKSFNILEPRKSSYKGTADAVYQNLDYLRKMNADTVLVLAGDHVYKMDYRRMLAFHEQMNADVTVGIIPVPIEEAHRFGTVTLDAEDGIVSFTEKTRLPRSSLASMGIYAFKPEVLYKCLIEDAKRADSSHDFGYSILPAVVNRDRVFAYQFDDYWQDIGTVEAYYSASMELLTHKPPLNLDGDYPVLTGNNGGKTIETPQQGYVENSIISPGCTILGRVEHSVLSPGVWVGEQAEVRNSVLMPNVAVGYHSVVDRCILDEEVNIDSLCYIGFGKALLPGDWDITVLGKGVSVPAQTAIGRNCRVLPHVSSWNFRGNMLLHSGSVLSHQGVDQGLSMNDEVGDERQGISVA
jgi:glucose-1-phosphate adenylyltransferase